MYKTLALLFVLLQISYQMEAQKGWNKTTKNGEIIYTPKDLPSGKIFSFIVSPAEAINKQNLKTWVQQRINEIQPRLGKVKKKWRFNKEKNGDISSSNIFIGKNGTAYSVGYEGGKLDSKRFFLIRMISSQDLSLLMKYGGKMKEVYDDARTDLLSGRVTTTPSKAPTKKHPKEETKKHQSKASEKRRNIKAAITTAPNRGLKKDKIEKVLFSTWWNAFYGEYSVDVFVLLKDGTVYTDCRIPINDLNVTQSKSLEPKRWSKWRKKSGKYEFFYTRNGAAKWKVIDSEPFLLATKGEKLNTTFTYYSGSQTFGSSKKSIKFLPNGRFELSSSFLGGGDMSGIGPYVGAASSSDKDGTKSSSVVIGGSVGGGSSSKKKDGSKNTGTYTFDGWAIEMHHDNGTARRKLFFFASKDKESIIIGTQKYFVYDDE